MESTRVRFLYEAVRLFGERGYDSVSMKDLAKAVGVVPSALYKHYSSKQALYDEIINEYKEGYARNMHRLKVDFAENPEEKDRIINMTEAEQIELAQSLLQSALHHPWANAFRKFMTVEQYHNQELARIYDKTYYKDQVHQHGAFFRILMDAGKMKEGNEYLLALQYISPINLLICMCDREPEKEEWAMEEIEKHVKEFNKNYRI